MTELPAPRSPTSRTLAMFRVVVHRLVANKLPQPNRSVPVSMLLETSELTDDGWWSQPGENKVLVLAEPVGALSRKRDPITARARAQKSSSAGRGIRRIRGAGKILQLNVTPFATGADAAERVSTYGNKVLESYSKLWNLDSFAVDEHNESSELELIQCVELSFSSGHRGRRIVRGVAGHVEKVHFFVSSSEIGTATPWANMLDLAARQAQKVRRISGIT
jgi:hypothetical protein